MAPAGGGSIGRASDRQERALKVRAELATGELVRVARAENQAEAELIQGLLLDHGVPSMLRRSAGFDVPDFMAAGPRDVLVPSAAVATTRELLHDAQPAASADAPGPRAPRSVDGAPVVRPWRLLAGLLVALALGLLIVWIGTLVIH